MLADEVDYVVGVDTHRDQHVLAVVVAPTGAVVAQTVGGSDRARLRGGAAVRGASTRAACVSGRSRAPATTAPGSTRYLASRGEVVHESGRSAACERRLRGKDDPLDAIRAARSALASDTIARCRARASGRRRCALLMLARRSAVDVRRLALVQLRSVIVTAPERLREELRPLPVGELIRRCSRFRRSSSRHTRRARERARAALARATHRGGDRRSRRARARDPRPRPRARARTARRARRRPDRRRATDRQLVTPRPRPLRSRLRTPRRRRTATRLERPDDPPPPQPRRRPPTQPRPPHRHPPPPPTRPGDQATTSPAASPKAKHTAKRPACSSATSPATSTASCRTPSPLMT